MELVSNKNKRGQVWRLAPFFFLFCLVFILLAPIPSAHAFDHSAYDAVLKKIVKEEGVDYAGLARDIQSLETYLDSFRSVPWEEVIQWNREDQLAFWINGFNALVLKLASGQKSGETVLTVDDPRFPNHAKLELKDRSFTPKEIRDEVLRRRFRDERIHCVLVDGSRSAPRLRPEAYSGPKLDRQMDDEIRKFLTTTSKNWIEPGKRHIFLAPVFKAFRDDFLLNYAVYESRIKKFTLSELAVLSFIAQHSSPEVVQYLEKTKYKIQYYPRDSRINRIG